MRPWSVPGVSPQPIVVRNPYPHDKGPRWGVEAGREAFALGPTRVNNGLSTYSGTEPVPALNSPTFVVDSSGGRSDASKPG